MSEHITTVGAATSIGSGKAEARAQCRCGWSATARGPASTVVAAARRIGDSHRESPTERVPVSPAITSVTVASPANDGRHRGGWIVAAVALAVCAISLALLVGNGSSQDRVPVAGTTASRPAETPYTPSPSPSPTPSPSPSTSEPETSSPEPAPVPEPQVEDRDELGLTMDDYVALGQAADLYGYGLGPGTSLTYEQAVNTAYGMTVPCSDVLVGGTTWEERVEEDVADGAPRADAEGFNAYLRDEFCPLLTEAALG